jgi:diaminopimelate epimerase
MRDSGQDMRQPFMKMHGLGNDFVVIDRRNSGVSLTPEQIRAIGDRHRGIGFDQLAMIDAADDAEAHLTFYNSDGSTSAACGNATRCIARHLMDVSGLDVLVLSTERGSLTCRDAGDGLTSVNMGAPFLDWSDVPLAEPMKTLNLPIDGDPVATGMGNPHCTFFVDDADGIDIAAFGQRFETHDLFPERTNVEVVQVLDRQTIRVRIWERGTGVTLASGSCSCAAAVAAARRELTGRDVRVIVDGGELQISWRDDGVWMTGPTTHVFDGILDLGALT